MRNKQQRIFAWCIDGFRTRPSMVVTEYGKNI
jgi:hypothetical protein